MQLHHAIDCHASRVEHFWFVTNTIHISIHYEYSDSLQKHM